MGPRLFSNLSLSGVGLSDNPILGAVMERKSFLDYCGVRGMVCIACPVRSGNLESDSRR